MDDLISRSKAIRWVKAECNPYGQPTIDYESGIKVIEHLERMSSAQPEVIRCENCRKRDDKWEAWEEGKVFYWCDIMDRRVKADDYCSYAEKRVGEADDETGSD